MYLFFLQFMVLLFENDEEMWDFGIALICFCDIPDHASIISFVGDTSAIEYVNEYQSDMLETMCTLLMQLIAGMIVVIIHI